MKNSSYTEKILANRSVLAYLGAILAMLVALGFALDFAFSAYASAEATEQKIQTMRRATEAYDQKKAILDNVSAKPVTEDKIDETQTGFLLLLQKHNLALANMSSVALSDSKEKNKVFEMEVSGSYANTMAFLSSFRKDAKAPVSILAVQFHPEKDILKTTVKYKVYVR